MKQNLSILAGGLLALSLSPQARAQDPSPSSTSQANYAPKAGWSDISGITITTLKGERLGEIQDLVLDVPNGQIVEILVVYGQVLGFGGTTVAVPPSALISVPGAKEFRLDMTAEAFKAAPKFDLSKWTQSTQTDQVAASYLYFSEPPKFLITGEAPGRKSMAGRPLTTLGTLDRLTDLSNLEVDNLNGEKLGRLQAFSLNLPSGRIDNVMVESSSANNIMPPTNKTEAFSKSTTVISPTMFSFNAKHDVLLLDLSQAAYNEEPRMKYETGAGGQVISYTEQPATTPPADSDQGASFRDSKITAQINSLIQSGNLDADKKVVVGTSDGRVTLRGTVANQATKDSIGAIAISVVKADNVDNQITVVPQLQASL